MLRGRVKRDNWETVKQARDYGRPERSSLILRILPVSGKAKLGHLISWLILGLVQGLKDVKVVKIASGNQHSLALDADGYVYGWGEGGYCRLGLGDQKHR